MKRLELFALYEEDIRRHRMSGKKFPKYQERNICFAFDIIYPYLITLHPIRSLYI